MRSRDASASELGPAVARMSVSEIKIVPGFRCAHPDYKQTIGKRSAERRIHPCPRGAIRCCHLKGASSAGPPPYPAPHAGEGWEGARLPALHSGACQSDRTLQLSPGRASREREGAGVTCAVDRA